MNKNHARENKFINPFIRISRHFAFNLLSTRTSKLGNIIVWILTFSLWKANSKPFKIDVYSYLNMILYFSLVIELLELKLQDKKYVKYFPSKTWHLKLVFFDSILQYSCFFCIIWEIVCFSFTPNSIWKSSLTYWYVVLHWSLSKCWSNLV